MYKLYVKRIVDFICAFFAIILLFPLFVLTGILIFFQDFGPSIFRQERVGKGGKLFKFYKFRSMPVNTPNVQSSDTGKLKITAFGKFIRRTNLDELPQLFNILKGDMSIFGPRPCIPSQERLIQLRTRNGSLECKPGLTGLAQVNSYDFMPEEEKANWDGIYASNITFKQDLHILLKTFLYLTKKPPTY
ncbi:O-antigen biosynthesis protein WbqP [Pedobacter africanus]|uniref:O-antigen biosynthesis protein WbqP n=1 Tax=Pedobacter africanus TaxID=151894 RepID=A0ACC6L421_9SPHI|nr:sugar transferase [Pedobacter africanus]MDR6786152.1 O-antigen biosynthesis protein WbqP [Pedobacter africanus]